MFHLALRQPSSNVEPAQQFHSIGSLVLRTYRSTFAILGRTLEEHRNVLVPLQRRLFMIALAAMGTITIPASGAVPRYVAVPLGTLGGTDSTANGINSRGDVTGASLAPVLQHAFVYSGGVMHDLGTLGGGSSSGAAINDSGLVTGT